MKSRFGRTMTWTLAACVGLAVGVAGAADEAEPDESAEKKPSISDSPYSKGPPPTTGGFTDTWQGGKKTSGAVPSGLMDGMGGAKPGSEKKDGDG